MATEIEGIRPWPAEAECDAPDCRQKVAWAIRFNGSETPGLSTLYLCTEHRQETETNYAKAMAT